jgi:hypothetical protein
MTTIAIATATATTAGTTSAAVGARAPFRLSADGSRLTALG